MLSFMVVRLVLFVLVVALLARHFGSMAGLGFLVGAIATRALLVRRAASGPEMHVDE